MAGSDELEVAEADDLTFQRASDHVASISESGDMSDTVLLQLYGLYKQAVFGPCTTFRPSFFDRKARSKW